MFNLIVFAANLCPREAHCLFFSSPSYFSVAIVTYQLQTIYCHQLTAKQSHATAMQCCPGRLDIDKGGKTFVLFLLD